MINNIVISVHAELSEESQVVTKLKELIKYDLDKEKVKIEKKNVKGLHETERLTLTVNIQRRGLAKKVVNHIISLLTDKDKLLLINTLDSRFSEDQHLFFRLNKDLFLKDCVSLCDKGECFHIKISIITFPRDVEKGKEEIKKMFN